MTRTLSYWGWGFEDSALDEGARQKLAMLLSTQMDVSALSPRVPLAVEALELPSCRDLAGAPIPLSTAPLDRARHTHGQAFRDVVRALEGDFSVAPDAVARPADEAELTALLDWCDARSFAVVPFGGGSSVVGGVEARFRDDVPAVISLDLECLAGVKEVDVTSRAARIAAGTFGPDLEAALAPQGLTLRHYPQSFERSTLGGWLATRAGGHFATLYTHIDDLLESMRVVTPRGVIETRRLPASGAGPSPDRLMLGSEGSLGIITEAWMRLQVRPKNKVSATLAFPDFYAAADAARLVAQSALFPTNCRVLDANEAMINGVGDGQRSFLLLAFEGGDAPRQPWLDRAVAIAESVGGVVTKGQAPQPAVEVVADEGDDAAQRWRKMFLRAPYLRDGLVRLGAITETFETAVLWCDFPDFHRRVKAAATDAVKRICGSGLVSSRITHVYPDGAAPYFTVIAPAKAGGGVAQWDEIKAAVSEVLLAEGGTITHHHAVGRDHRAWAQRQRPPLFTAMLRAAKREVDPHGILNPGVLI